LALATASANGADGNHGFGGFNLGFFGAHQAKISPQGVNQSRFVHHVIVGNITVSEYDLINFELLDQFR